MDADKRWQLRHKILVFIALQHMWRRIFYSLDGLLGTRTRRGRMVGADESTELWREPLSDVTFLQATQVNERYREPPLVYQCPLGNGKSTWTIYCLNFWLQSRDRILDFKVAMRTSRPGTSTWTRSGTTANGCTSWTPTSDRCKKKCSLDTFTSYVNILNRIIFSRGAWGARIPGNWLAS